MSPTEVSAEQEKTYKHVDTQWEIEQGSPEAPVLRQETQSMKAATCHLTHTWCHMQA